MGPLHDVTIDISQTSHSQVGLTPVTPASTSPIVPNTSGPVSLSLESAEYTIQPGSSIFLPCNVVLDSAGLWQFPAGCDAYVKGRGTTALALVGFAITIDARGLAMSTLGPLWFAQNVISTATAQVVRLLPLRDGDLYQYTATAGAVSSCAFSVNSAGAVVVRAADAPCESAKASTLRINGFKVGVTSKLSSSFVLPVWPGAQPIVPGVSSTLLLLPLDVGSYQVQQGSGLVSSCSFNLDRSALVTVSSPACGTGGTKRLALDGTVAQVDTTRFTPDPAVVTLGQDAWHPTFPGGLKTVRLLPGRYGFGSSSTTSQDFQWDLTTLGEITVPDGQPGATSTCATSLKNVLVVGCPTLSVGGSTVVEGTGGSNVAVFNLRLSDPASAPVVVTYSTVAGTAVDGTDFVPRAGSLTINRGATSAVVRVPVITDTSVEPKIESFTLDVSVAGSARLSSAPPATVRIADDDVVGAPPPKAPRFAVGMVEVPEGDTGGANVVIPVYRYGAPLVLDQTVAFSIESGAPWVEAPFDYLPTTGTVGFNKSDSLGYATASVVGDIAPEPLDEYVVVRLADPTTNAAVGSGLLRLVDDD